MKRFKIYGALFLFNFLLQTSVISCISESETSLELVQILFRHGDRTPIRAYPFDPYNETTWTDFGGYGQLITSGIQRAHQFGTFLRRTYAKFLSDFYNKNEVLIRSTDYDRTIMTAQSILSGLFPPKEYQKWDNLTNWQPIPVHTVDVKADNLFYMHQCPLSKDLYDEVKNGPEFRNYLADNMNFLSQLNKEINPKSNVTIDDMEHLADGIFIQKQKGLQLPEWADKYYDKIVKLGRYSYNFYFLKSEQARLAAGAVLNEMLENIQTKLNNTTSRNKLYLYSSHDTYVAALTRLLELIAPITQSPYVSAVVLELRRSLQDTSKYYVQCIFKNNTIDEEINFNRLRIRSCSDFLCPLDEFLQLTKELLVKDFKNECRSKEKPRENIGKLRYSLLFYASISVTFTFAILFSIISIMNYFYYKQLTIKNSRSNQSRQYETVNLIIGDFNEDDDLVLDTTTAGGSNNNKNKISEK